MKPSPQAIKIAGLLTKLAAKDAEIERLKAWKEHPLSTCRERIADLEAEIERLQGELVVVRKLQDTFWAALKKLNLQSIYVTNPGLHFTERISELEAALRQQQDECERFHKPA